MKDLFCFPTLKLLHALLKLCLLHSMLSKTKPQQAMMSAAQTLGGYECTCELLSKTW